MHPSPENPKSQPQPFHCPSCGAALKYRNSPTVTCSYCGAQVLIPDEFRPQKPQITIIKPSARKSSPILLLAFLGFSLCIAGFIVAAYMQTKTTAKLEAPILTGVANQVYAIETDAIEIEGIPLIEASTPAPAPFASQVLMFGGEGKEAGQFEDPRYIVVDLAGNIFVGDYSDGRIQKFDPQGNFQLLIQVTAEDNDDDVYIRGMDVDADGQLYVAREGDILKYNGKDGALLATISDRWPEIYYDSVVVHENRLYVTNGMAGTDDLILLTTQGDLVARYRDVIEKVEDDDPAINLSIAVSPEGNAYMLSGMGQQVYVYNNEGVFLFRFGEGGDMPGQFNSFPDAIIIDQQGRVYIASSYRVDIYSSQGEYLGKSLEINYELAKGSIRDLCLDVQRNIYLITTSGKVIKFHPLENDR